MGFINWLYFKQKRKEYGAKIRTNKKKSKRCRIINIIIN